MIFTLPKKFNGAGRKLFLEDGGASLILSRVKKGAMLYCLGGSKPVGQIFLYKRRRRGGEYARVSVADSGSYDVALDRISPVPDGSRSGNSDFFVFGKANSYKYDLYERREGEKMPLLRAEANEKPLNEEYYDVRINEGGNLFRILLIVVALGLLNE